MCIGIKCVEFSVNLLGNAFHLDKLTGWGRRALIRQGAQKPMITLEVQDFTTWVGHLVNTAFIRHALNKSCFYDWKMSRCVGDASYLNFVVTSPTCCNFVFQIFLLLGNVNALWVPQRAQTIISQTIISKEWSVLTVRHDKSTSLQTCIGPCEIS